MSHRHFCDVTDHRWDCNGAAQRIEESQPSVRTCYACRAPLEQGGHSRCRNLVELVACPGHRDEQLRRREEAAKDFERRATQFGFDRKWALMKSLLGGPERAALAEGIVAWLFGNGDMPQT